VEACAHSVARVDTFSFKSFEENRNELEISSCSNLEMGNFRSGKKFHDLQFPLLQSRIGHAAAPR
jgi:hypothetical protein